MYGQAGEKPHPIAAQRPGATFGIFVKEIKKALVMSLNMPNVSLFKDVAETNYAGFRSAMLDAWRVFSHRRAWLGRRFNDPRRNMLLEEAYLLGELGVNDFYSKRHFYTACEWIGPPKGTIEPVKEAQADILRIKNKLKTRAKTIREQDGGDWVQVFDQLEEENDELEARDMDPGLDEGAVIDRGDEEQGGWED